MAPDEHRAALYRDQIAPNIRKAAVLAFALGFNIHYQQVEPSVRSSWAIYTPIWDVMLGEGKQREETINSISAEIPLGVMGKPEDVAYAALYLASDESKYVTGIELNIDGGILAGSTAAPSGK